nr:MAG TPA: hypothetical protein [Caudoviricetes sp.]
MSILNDLKICYYLSKINASINSDEKEKYERKLRKVMLI